MTRQPRTRGSTSNTPGATKAKGKRGAPQTFAATLFRILHEGTPIVGWSPEGDSFTVHNDKEFEREVLTANYRHGKFSSFQRQLNMYGFRKVADCSDRTYSHPFFPRNCPELLAKVRRVVSSGAPNNNRGSSSCVSGGGAADCGGNTLAVRDARSKPKKKRTVEISVAARGVAGEQECGYGSHTTGESDEGGHARDSRPPTRKKARTGAGRSTAGVASTAFVQHHGAGGAAATASTVNASGGGLFPRPLQYFDASAMPPGVPPQPASARRAQGNGGGAIAKPVQAQQQEFSSSWHHHTGLWGGVTNSFDDAWTSGSGSSSVSSSIEASSPVLLPINPADLDCRNNIHPFLLPPAPISPSPSSCAVAAAAAGGLRSGTGGGLDPPSRVTFATERKYASATTTGGGGGGGGGAGDSGASNINSNSGKTYASTYDNPLSLDKAFGFGTAIARCPSFELIFDPEDLVVDASAAPTATAAVNSLGSTVPVPISPTAPVDAIAAAASTVAAAAAAAAADTGADANVDVATPASVSARPPNTSGAGTSGSIGWDLSSWASTGWGNPDASDSTAAEAWAALPSLGNMNRASRSSLPSLGEEPGGGGGGGGGGLGLSLAQQHGSSSAVVAEERACGASGAVGLVQQQQQQQPLHKRTLSSMSAFSMAVADAAVDSLDWTLFDQDEGAAGAAGGGSGSGSGGGTDASVTGTVGFDDAAVAFGGVSRTSSSFFASDLSAPPPPPPPPPPSGADGPCAPVASVFSSSVDVMGLAGVPPARRVGGGNENA